MTEKLYRTVIVYEVLSDRPVGDMDIADIVRECYEGDFSGATLTEMAETVTPEKMAALSESQGSDVEFIIGAELEEELDTDAVQQAKIQVEREHDAITTSTNALLLSQFMKRSEWVD